MGDLIVWGLIGYGVYQMFKLFSGDGDGQAAQPPPPQPTAPTVKQRMAGAAAAGGIKLLFALLTGHTGSHGHKKHH